MSVARVVNDPRKYWAHRLSSSPRPLPRQFGSRSSTVLHCGSEVVDNVVETRARSEQDDGSSEPIWPFQMLQRASTARGSRVVDTLCGAVPKACVASAIRVLSGLRGLAVAAQPVAFAASLAARIPGPVVSGTLKGAIGC
jgi:hypothetical protein